MDSIPPIQSLEKTKQLLPSKCEFYTGVYNEVYRLFWGSLHLAPLPKIRALCKDCAGWHDYFECPALKGRS